MCSALVCDIVVGCDGISGVVVGSSACARRRPGGAVERLPVLARADLASNGGIHIGQQHREDAVGVEVDTDTLHLGLYL